MFADVDRVIVGEDAGLECKTANAYHADKWKAGEIPLHVFDHKLERRMELQNLIKKLETEQRQIDQEIKLYMGEMEKGYTDHYRVSWSQVDTVRLDSKKLKKEQPEIYKAFSNTSSSRRFTVKQINAA